MVQHTMCAAAFGNKINSTSYSVVQIFRTCKFFLLECEQLPDFTADDMVVGEDGALYTDLCSALA